MRLNLGCGPITHPDWVNVDYQAAAPGVLSADLQKPLPFGAASASCVYASHVIEHFEKRQAPKFLDECFRVLKPGGIIRLVVPDLEALARAYLELIEPCLAGDLEAQGRYEWTLLELIDQLVRTRSGGEMLAFWSQNPMPAENYVLERAGRDVRDFIAAYRDKGIAHPNVGLLDKPLCPEEGPGYLALRESGELHKWMYDRFSLGKLMSRAGFVRVRKLGFAESEIPDFNRFGLDAEADGRPRKPDSLYMEGVKPDLAVR